MIIMNASGGGRLEKVASYARSKRVGPFVFISGTTSMQSDGTVFAPYDTEEQTRYIINKMEEALQAVGSELAHVVRTRAYITDMRDAGGFIKVHGEVFKGIEPTLTGVQAGLTTPGMMVEIEFDAIVHNDTDSLQELEGGSLENETHTAEFKAKVALEALNSELTLSQVAAKHSVNPNLVARWKREAIDNMSDIFSS
ncbi:MAG: transposase [Gammaproteobacteria bacterium]|nr:transposase [Gammaproteobacteria bacterium]